MKVQQTPNLQVNSRNQNSIKKDRSDVAFGGATDTFVQFLKFLDTNQAWGATSVDIGCMVLPRTAVDFTRGPEAGLETARREASGSVNHALVGGYGLLAAALLSSSFNKKFKVQANKMFLTNDTLDILGQTYKENLHIENPDKRMESYLKKLLGHVSAYNPEHELSDSAGHVKLDDKTTDNAVKRLMDEFKNKSLSGASNDYLKNIMTSSLGVESQVKLERDVDIAGKIVNKKSVSSLEMLIDNIYKVSKSFKSEQVVNAFNDTKDLSANKFISGLKKINTKTSLIGLGIAGLVGVSVQPFNMYLTKKKTGQDGFVGVEGRKPDKSTGFKALKFAVATGFCAAVLRTIGKPKEILSKIQFRGFTPTINQFKFVYGVTIMSRFLSARDKNELRESTIKDSLGFVNWLIFGGFVSKLTAAGFEKMARFKNDKFIKHNEAENGKGWFNWLTKSTTVTRDEVLHTALKKVGVSTIKEVNGKQVAMTFKEMMKLATKHCPEVKSKLMCLNVIQLSGYLYSGLVLGLGIPKLNIAITNSIEKKRKAHDELKNQKV